MLTTNRSVTRAARFSKRKGLTNKGPLQKDFRYSPSAHKTAITVGIRHDGGEVLRLRLELHDFDGYFRRRLEGLLVGLAESAVWVASLHLNQFSRFDWPPAPVRAYESLLGSGAGKSMSQESRHDAWQAGDSYDLYMGRWSRQIAPHFLDWLDPAQRLAWLDVGCSTGALSAAILDRGIPTSLISVDPSEGFLTRARANVVDESVEFRVGDA